MFPYAFSLIQLYSQTQLHHWRLFCSHMHSNWSNYTVKLKKLPRIGCFTQSNSTTIKSILSSAYFLLIWINTDINFYFTFGPTAQIFAKTPKYEWPIIFFMRTHAHWILRSHSTSFVHPIYNLVKKSLLFSPD